MENFKTAHVRFEDANIKFMENKISMLWTDTGCSTNCKKTSVVKLDDIDHQTWDIADTHYKEEICYVVGKRADSPGHRYEYDGHHCHVHLEAQCTHTVQEI